MDTGPSSILYAEAKSQVLTVPSAPADASMRPSGETATLRTRPTCPRRTFNSLPSAASQTRIVPSLLQETKVRPSGV